LAGDDDGIPSADLVAALVAMPERSWGECNRGKPLTQNGLARRLKAFKIASGDVHIYDGQSRRSIKGYAVKSLREAFARYIPLDSSAPPRNSNKNNDVGKNQTAPVRNGGADENSANSLKSQHWRGGADESGLDGGMKGGGADESLQTGDSRECADDLAAATGPKPPFSTRERI
jgi:hypothetical protein